jgi:simple sugar transport system permease protein
METLNTLANELASLLRSGAPLILAALGETFTERVGVVNLSLDGTMVLAGLAAFVAGVGTGSILIGALAGMLVGLLVALLVAFCSLDLKMSQVAVGFVLTLLCRDLAIFLGRSYIGVAGLTPSYFNIPLLSEIPFIGKILFQQDVFTYLSLIGVIGVWFWIFRTQAGLQLRTVGERPETAFARGISVRLTRYVYCGVGGLLVGLAGATYTLNVTSKWSESDITGNGWIALAIVIFGGWYPLRIAFGAYLVRGLSLLASRLQGSVISIPPSLLNAVPWVLMLITLALVSSGLLNRLSNRLPPRFRGIGQSLLRTRPPAALGSAFESEKF